MYGYVIKSITTADITVLELELV